MDPLELNEIPSPFLEFIMGLMKKVELNHTQSNTKLVPYVREKRHGLKFPIPKVINSVQKSWLYIKSMGVEMVPKFPSSQFPKKSPHT
jgi:hypothetical protein